MTADQMARLLDELGARLEGPARYVFDLAVRQSIIESALWWVAAVPLVFLLVGFMAAYGWHFRDDHRECDHDRLYVVLVGMLVSGIFAAIALCVAVASLPKLLNPEYAALLRIVEALK